MKCEHIFKNQEIVGPTSVKCKDCGETMVVPKSTIEILRNTY